MKHLLKITFIVTIALAVISTAFSVPAKQGKIKVLFLVGGGFHDFTNLPPIMKTALEASGDFTVTITEDRNELTAPKISKYDAVLFYTQGGDLTPEQEKGLMEFIAGGKGYAGIHCASDSFKSSDAYWNLVGGQFTGHGFGDFTINITGKRHPIVKGMSNFQIKDEDYDNKIHPKANIMVLARWANDGQPAIWVQNYGQGRVFYTGMGHGKEAFENKSFQEVMIRGLRWVAGLDPVPAENAAAPACCEGK